MIKAFRIGERVFSPQERILIIAEIGTGHNGSLQKAKELIAAAKESGADAVKFQIVYADEILHPDTGFVNLPTGRIPLYERFRELECSIDFYAELAQYAHKCGMLFSASAFGLRSADELRQLNPAFIKIASPELNHFPLLEHVASLGLPVILSSGVSMLGDIERAIRCLETCGLPADMWALLHCVTAYPAPETDYNTAVLQSLSALFNSPVGISDHSLDPAAVPIAGLLCGACIIEKHICLSRNDAGLDDPVALEPAQFLLMSSIVRNLTGKSNEDIFNAAQAYGYSKVFLRRIIGGGEKKLAAAEKDNYGKTNRSLHYVKDLPKGTVLKDNDVAVLRTEKNLTVGESPEYLHYFVGAVLQKEVKGGAGAVFNDIIERKIP
ncbi:N-acetylneuraminate synthase family protein [Treponema vincentii]|uniref:N-acetylneuraminate synthase family protein n=1 Tax=Treponema vincentii TaxID=69710 RepID=UPI0020A2C118|nr:N-acetylneuraminate synthase family protein [Treponema vincentii]UTC60076.1 N-acetylneuraminate synthase family protein [Treponema vincentii]